MMSIVFANFWTWSGTVILVAVALGGIAECIRALRPPTRTIKSYNFNGGTCTVEIENATHEDLRWVVERCHKSASRLAEEAGDDGEA